MLEVRLLRYFLAIAEDGSFTTAAQHLHISQPALSQQIKSLEQALGASLFIRSASPVRLTPAGEQLVQHAHRVLSAVTDAEDSVLAFTTASTGRLKIGVVYGGFYDILHPILTDLRQQRPEARFPVHQLPSSIQLSAVRRHDVDLLLYRRTDESSLNGLSIHPLREDRMIAVVPADHPAITSDGSISLADLAEDRFAAFQRAWMPLVYDRCLAACHAAGFTPDIAEHCTDPLSLAFAVAGGAVALTGDGMASRYPGIVYAPVTPYTSTAEISAVWLPDNANPLLPMFLERVVAQCAQDSSITAMVPARIPGP